jgi:hypothetical protein
MVPGVFYVLVSVCSITLCVRGIRAFLANLYFSYLVCLYWYDPETLKHNGTNCSSFGVELR